MTAISISDCGPGSQEIAIRDVRLIESVIFEHGAAFDEKRAENIATLYIPDGVLSIQGRRIIGTDALNAHGASRSADRSRQTRHVITNIRLTRVGERTIESRSTVTVYELSGKPPRTPVVSLVGDYVDVFEKQTNEGWLLAERIVTW